MGVSRQSNDSRTSVWPVNRPGQHCCTLGLRRSPMVKTTLLRTSKSSFLAAVLCCGLASAQSSSSVASKIVASANGFLSLLDEAQRSKVLFEFNDAAQPMARVFCHLMPSRAIAEPQALIQVLKLESQGGSCGEDLFLGCCLEPWQWLLHRR